MYCEEVSHLGCHFWFVKVALLSYFMINGTVFRWRESLVGVAQIARTGIACFNTNHPNLNVIYRWVPFFCLQINLTTIVNSVQVFQLTWRLHKTRLSIFPPRQIGPSRRSAQQTSRQQTSKKYIKILQRKWPGFSISPISFISSGQTSTSRQWLIQFWSVEEKHIKIFKRKWSEFSCR